MTDPELAAIVERPRLVRWLADEGSTYVLTRTVLLRLLGVVYFVAFLGAYRQGPGLVGTHGILPFDRYLHAVARVAGSPFAGFVRAPSLLWLDPTDGLLRALLIAGMALALLVVAGVTNALALLALWVIQLSLADVGQVFWGYGWEMQLLETGMLAVVACPLRSLTWRTEPPRAVIWLFRWLVARIMLGAGLIKLRGDPCWRDLTCLDVFYETQPNPSPLSWALHHAPHVVHAAGVVVNHVVELAVPFLILGPRPVRRAAGVTLILFQLFLILSGNLAFLNWLTIVPAIACLDDGFWRFRGGARPPSRVHRRVALGYAAVVAFLSLAPVANLFSEHQAMNASFEPLHLVNTYGAFGSVTPERRELVIEGTTATDVDDDTVWRTYELPCKPGDPGRRPCFVAPYHYRLDWQMWFAAMEDGDEAPWLPMLVDLLLRGEPAVKPLFAVDPFPGTPPHFVRVRLKTYRFTARGEPGWWTVEEGPDWLKAVSLDDPHFAEFLALHRLRW